MAEKGPWFGAMYDGKCSGNECTITEGDRIRADGNGGYECEDCGEDNGPVPLPERQDAGLANYPDAVASSAPLPTAEEFLSPVVGADPVAARFITADEFLDSTVADDSPKLNVSGQPPARYEIDKAGRNKGYIVTDPETGDLFRYGNGNPKGQTRATTFIKHGSDKKAINDWGKRNVVIGLSRRPDLLVAAHNLNHEDDKFRLMDIVAQAEEAAGAKVGSDIGSYLHEFTERMDAGQANPEDAPTVYQDILKKYREELDKHGFEMVPGLIERTTMIREFGVVVGTFDRILFHRPSGTYMVGDLKTGQTMKYGFHEMESQLWIYAHGMNQNGIYDWNTDTWEEPHTLENINVRLNVREDVGVIIHMPIQGDLHGGVYLKRADLTKGATRAQLCHNVKTAPGPKPVTWSWEQELEPAGDPAIDWDDAFSHVVTDEQATEYWRRAKAAGIKGIELNRLIDLARQSLARYSHGQG